jgi:hypothetical protein
MGPASAISSLVTPPAVWVDTMNPGAQTPSVASAVITRTIPSQMVECEGKKCAGLWEFHGNRKGMVNWPDGGRGDVTISQFDSELVKIHRKDDNGFWADYSGIIAGNSITGEVVWHFQDGRVLKGKWSATFGEAIGAELAAGRQRDAIRGLLGAFGSDEPEWKRKGFASEEAYETNQYNCHTGKGICHD